jgi:hypothetical protein
MTGRAPSAFWCFGEQDPRPVGQRRVACSLHHCVGLLRAFGADSYGRATHLRAVFAKLGIQSRVQLANELHKLDGDPTLRVP